VSVTVQEANGSTATTDSTDTVTLAIDNDHNLGNGTLTCTGGLSAGVNGILDTGDNALTGYTYATGSIPQF